MVGSSSLLLPVRQSGPEQRTAAVQLRHDRSERSVEGLGNLLAGHLLHVAQHDDLLVLVGNGPQGGQQLVVGQLLRNGGNECGGRRDAIVDIRHKCKSAAGAASVAAHVMQDRDKPRATVVPGV